jgi:hypothetical protein
MDMWERGEVLLLFGVGVVGVQFLKVIERL